MFGTVGGLSGINAILAMNVLNPIVSGTIFFDGIDIFDVLNPIPPVPPIPTNNAIASLVFPTNYMLLDQSLFGLMVTENELLLDNVQFKEHTHDDCDMLTPDIEICPAKFFAPID
jgi:hypothetical protein